MIVEHRKEKAKIEITLNIWNHTHYHTLSHWYVY
jgi:hypothetical protein